MAPGAWTPWLSPEFLFEFWPSCLLPQFVDILCWFVLLEVGFSVVYALSPWLARLSGLPNGQFENKVEFVDNLLGFLVYPYVGFLALSGSAALHHSPQARWFGEHEYSHKLLTFYLAMQLYHVLTVTVRETDRTLKLQLLVHHAASMYCFTSCLCLNRLAYWACLDTVCEVTNVFLSGVYVMRGLKMEETIAYKLNGVLLWLSFLVFRLALFPYWLWSFYQDYSSLPASTVGLVSRLELLVYPTVTLFLLVLSVLWFVQITSGLLQALRALLQANSSVKKAGKAE